MFSFAPAPGFFGLDQVNIGLISHSFINGCTLEVQLIVDGQATNVVEIRCGASIPTAFGGEGDTPNPNR